MWNAGTLILPSFAKIRNWRKTRRDYDLSLPDDVLLKFFLFAKEPVLVSHICRAWRSTAIGHPLLWTDIAIDHCHSRQDAFLHRSRGSLLMVSCRSLCDDDCDKCIQCIQNLSHHLNRTQSLEVEMTEASMLYLLDSFAKQETFILRQLNLSCIKRLDASEAVPIFLPLSLVMLRALSLTNVEMVTPTILNKLTHLTLSTEDFRPQNKCLSLMDMYRTLKECFALEDLIIKSCWTAHEPDTVPESDLCLRNLSRITLDKVPYSLCSYFANTIKSNNRIDWICHTDMGYIWPDHMFLSTILSPYQQTRGTSCSLTLKLFSEKTQFIVFYPRSTSYGKALRGDADDSETWLRLEVFDHFENPGSLSSIVKSFIKALNSFSTLTCLNLQLSESLFLPYGLSETKRGYTERELSFFHYKIRHDYWESLLKDMTRLKELHVQLPNTTEMWEMEREATQDIFEALVPSPLKGVRVLVNDYVGITSTQPSMGETSICPQLSSITFERGSYRTGEVDRPSMEIRNICDAQLQSLVNSLGLFDEQITALCRAREARTSYIPGKIDVVQLLRRRFCMFCCLDCFLERDLFAIVSNIIGRLLGLKHGAYSLRQRKRRDSTDQELSMMARFITFALLFYFCLVYFVNRQH